MRAPTLAGTLRRKRNLSEIAGNAFNFYGHDWRGFVTIGAATIPASVGGSLIGGLIEDDLTRSLATAAWFLASFGLYAIVEAAVISFLLQIDGGTPADERIAFRAAFSRMGDLLRATYRFVILVALMAVTIVGIPAAIDRMVRWIFAAQAVIMDAQTSATALSFSAAQVKGHWWRTLGRVIFIGLMIAVLSSVTTGLAASAPLLGYALVVAIAGAFTGPYFSIALTLAYVDLKLRQAEAGVPAS